MSADFSLQKPLSSSNLPRPISRTYVDFSAVATKTQVDIPASKPPTHGESPLTTPAQKQLETTQRNALLSITHRESSPKTRLQNALTHYDNHKDSVPAPTSQSWLEKIAAQLGPQPDPNVHKFNELHTLYATAIQVCGGAMRQLISEDDMQHTVETVWKTGKVDVSTLELFETAVLSVVHNTLTQES